VLFPRPMVGGLVENRESTARDHLANERTFLAWVRTALGLVGLGVLLERLVADGGAIAVAAGIGFIGFGGLSLIYAVSRYIRVAKNLERGMFPVAVRGPLVIAFGALMVTAGAMLYVLLLR
jgi:putative membrane protein